MLERLSLFRQTIRPSGCETSVIVAEVVVVATTTATLRSLTPGPRFTYANLLTFIDQGPRFRTEM